MKPLVSILLALALGASSSGAQTAKKEVTVYGEVVDIANYVRFGTKPDNPDRIAIAEAGIRSGNPLGILERETKKVYIVTNNQAGVSANERLRRFFGQRVFVKGMLFRRGGTTLLIMSDIGKSVK